MIIDYRKLQVYVFAQIKSKDFQPEIMIGDRRATLLVAESIPAIGVVPNR